VLREDSVRLDRRLISLIEKLIKTHKLTVEEYEYLIEKRNSEATKFLASEAVRVRKEIYGDTVFIRGLIEISNICKNDCYYC